MTNKQSLGGRDKLSMLLLSYLIVIISVIKSGGPATAVGFILAILLPSVILYFIFVWIQLRNLYYKLLGFFLKDKTLKNSNLSNGYMIPLMIVSFLVTIYYFILSYLMYIGSRTLGEDIQYYNLAISIINDYTYLFIILLMLLLIVFQAVFLKKYSQISIYKSFLISTILVLLFFLAFIAVKLMYVVFFKGIPYSPEIKQPLSNLS